MSGQIETETALDLMLRWEKAEQRATTAETALSAAQADNARLRGALEAYMTCVPPITGAERAAAFKAREALRQGTGTDGEDSVQGRQQKTATGLRALEAG